MLPAPVIVRVPADQVKPVALVNKTVPVETLMVCVFVADRVGVPATVSVFAPTANVMFAATLFGFIDKFPVVPLIVKLQPALIVSVVAVAVAFPIVSEPQTAFELIVRLTPEFITAFSEAVGTCPRLHVAPSHVVPTEAVFVCANASVPKVGDRISAITAQRAIVSNIFESFFTLLQSWVGTPNPGRLDSKKKRGTE